MTPKAKRKPANDKVAYALLDAARYFNDKARELNPLVDGPHDERGLVAVGERAAYLHAAGWCMDRMREARPALRRRGGGDERGSGTDPGLDGR